MADVTEVIHKITYEVNNDALNNATQAIQAQIAELNKLTASLNGYSSQLAKLSSDEVRAIGELKAKINELGKEMERTAGKSAGVLQTLLKGATQGIAGSKDLKDAVAGYVAGIVKEFKQVEEAGKKIEQTNRVVVQGFRQDVREMAEENTKTSSSFDKLAKGLGSVTGALDIGIQLLIMFADEMQDADEKLGLITGSMEAMNEVNRSASADIARVTTEIEILKSRFFDAKATVQSKTAVIEEMNRKYGDTIGKIKSITEAEDFFVNRSEAFVRAMTIRAQIQGAYNLIAANHQKLLEAQSKAPAENVGWFTKALLGLESTFKPGASDVVRDYNRVLKNESDSILKEAKIENDRTTTMLQQFLKGMYTELDKLEKEFNFKPEHTPGKSNGGNNTSTNKNPVKNKPEKPARPQERVSYMETGKLQMLPVEPADGAIKPVDTERMMREQKEKEGAEARAKRKENIKSAIDDYKVLSEAAVEAYNTIVQAQIDALDKEIAIKEKRVEEAKKLAEQGNVEALRIEEERLRKAQEQRARFARQQQAINAAITVSNAIAAVARAALEGGGFGSVATIAALIAALAAGYAAVTSMTSSNEAYADGVVDYRGKGGPRDDKNWVRISSGESIITAEGTQKNRALLEAINKGAALHMIDPSLPLLMPAFKQPGIGNNTYANSKDLKQLEGKLDEVVGAIQDNKLRQNIFFNEQGVGIMTERAMKKDRKRWI